MVTLGERLRAQQEALVRAGVDKQQQADSNALVKQRAHDRKVRGFFEDIKEATISGIERGCVPKPTQLPEFCRHPHHSQTLITDPIHPDHRLFKEFEVWLTENDLIAKCWYAHDGVGMRDWTMFAVEPAPNAVAPFDKLMLVAHQQMILGNTGDALAAVLAALTEAKKTGQAIIDEAGTIEQIKNLLGQTGIHTF